MPKFIRTKEDFICEKCGFAVTGDGYTNHCPNCLWSKHVDINPGDRREACAGLMEPIALEGSVDEFVIMYRCTKCRKRGRNKAKKKDSVEALLALAKARGK